MQPDVWVERTRLVLDAGVHAPLGRTPLYLLGGFGYQVVTDHHAAGKLRASHYCENALGCVARPTDFVRGGTSIRFLLAVGVGF